LPITRSVLPLTPSLLLSIPANPTVVSLTTVIRAFRKGAQRLRRVARCNVEIYSTKAKIRRRTIASSHSLDTQPPDSGLAISRIYRSPHTGIFRVPWTNLSTLPSITSCTRETGKTPLFASESLVKSDGGDLSDFAADPSPIPDTPWQEAQDRRNSFRPFSSGCACDGTTCSRAARLEEWRKLQVVAERLDRFVDRQARILGRDLVLAGFKPLWPDLNLKVAGFAFTVA
jgi:hypothetical protein